MNNEFDNFSNAIDNISVERKKTKFKLIQLKLEHYHWNSGDIDVGIPVSTSIELTCEYNFEKEKLEWKKNISHTYLSLDNYNENTTDIHTQKIDNPDILIKEIEKYDLRNLKNNYYTDEKPNRFTHWELTYNNCFKVVGTYDQVVEEVTKISDILDFRKIIKEETKKVQDRIENQKTNGGNIWN